MQWWPVYRAAILTLLAWLLSAPALALGPQQDVQQILYSLGVQRFFDSMALLVERELERDESGQADASDEGERIRQQLSKASLQQAVEATLLQQYDAALYRQAIDTLARPDLVPVIQSCHGQALQDYGPQLDAYRQQLQQQSARAERNRLALQLDQAARSSELASQLHSGIERIIYQHVTPEPQPDIAWQEVASERQQLLQQAMQTWYLYCGRYFRDDLLQGLADSYRDPSVQQLLDQYQAALAAALEQAAANIAGDERD